jgi:hypothetical protein
MHIEENGECSAEAGFSLLSSSPALGGRPNFLFSGAKNWITRTSRAMTKMLCKTNFCKVPAFAARDR